MNDMGNLALFMKKNKTVKENGFYAATKSLCDDNGDPLKWEIKHLTTSESEELREKCTYEVQVTGKVGMYRQKLNTKKYLASMIAASVVFPDLMNAELQDSYGVSTPEDLLMEMIDDPSEWAAFGEFIQTFNGFTETMQEKVDEAKN